jgi:hypothetical protein
VVDVVKSEMAKPELVQPAQVTQPDAAKSGVLKSAAFYWFVVIVAAGVLLSGWAVALINIIHGTTVQSG